MIGKFYTKSLPPGKMSLCLILILNLWLVNSDLDGMVFFVITNIFPDGADELSNEKTGKTFLVNG